ncbi:hypothetical protein SAMN02746066_03018 [Anaerosporobacter mobilis DSM 15930]|uniref:Uncharacterized protein n=1 Tax=Anaerosporobacter mobilis DSM 15930 TaxID=1120996 RepID=A0A1M7L204_9FIRM|nr:hypothetical protein [Anaerosporobacter mobilis]SHM71931.1 hypothetical protein SAMN02746066_03018 [Anaerosporobacter mobilis DSM 15930]
MNNVISWLLEGENPEVKYRTMIELLDIPKDDPEVKKAYDDLLKSDIVGLIMDKFKLNNKWEDVTALCALAEFGLTRVDVPIDDYIERVIKNMDYSMKCAKILLLRNLVSLGYYKHTWVKEEIALAFSNIREDGTFRCLDKTKKSNDSKLPDMGCYRQTTTYLLLAAELKKIDVILPQFKLLINFYINHYVAFHSDNQGKAIIKEMVGTYYPFDHVKLGLQMTIYGLSVLGGANHSNCNKALALLESKKDCEGKYILDKSFPYFEVGNIGEPNKWITLYALLSEKYRIV